MQAGDRFRGGSEDGIAGGRVPALAGLDELNLMRVQAAHAATARSPPSGLAG